MCYSKSKHLINKKALESSGAFLLIFNIIYRVIPSTAE